MSEAAVKETLEKLITLVQVYGEQTSRLPMLFVSSQAEKQLIMKSRKEVFKNKNGHEALRIENSILHKLSVVTQKR